MIDCPNCNKKMNERFEYCRICGSKLNGEKLGDYSTEINNLFKDGDEYYYIFAVNGKQLIIRNSDKEELKKEVLNRNYPWIEKKEKVEEKIENSKEAILQTKDKHLTQTPQQTKPRQQQDQHKNEKKETYEFKDDFAYVTKEEDVNFGKIRIYDPISGQSYETWGPDNSERAKRLRRKIFK